MSSFDRTYQLSRVLIVSQLRSSRSSSGRGQLWERPSFILAMDLIALVASCLVTLLVLSFVSDLLGSLSLLITMQLLASVPMFALAIVILAGMMFEMNASSRFASSDLVNWLPISKSEYVASSAISVSYIYSVYLCVASGLTLGLAIQDHLVFAWMVSFVLSLTALLTGGFIVEIIRASVNRVYSAMSKRTGRATLILRLVIAILLIVVFQVLFYPNLLLSVMNRFVGALDASFFVPLVWPSPVVIYVMAEDFTRTVIFTGLSILFVVVVFFSAIAVRSRYWSPVSVTMTFKSKLGYNPRYSKLMLVGLSNIEASIVSKDLKGYIRRKELLSFLAMPFIFTAIILIQQFSFGSIEGAASEMSFSVSWFVGFFAIFFSASSIGTESKSIANMYMLPVSAKHILTAKLTTSLALSVVAALLMGMVSALFSELNPHFFFGVVLMSILIAVQSVFIGLCFATRYSDFEERPKPKFLSTMGMLMAMLIGTGALLLTNISVLLFFDSLPYLSVLASIAAATAISIIAHRYAIRGAEKLMIEMKT